MLEQNLFQTDTKLDQQSSEFAPSSLLFLELFNFFFVSLFVRVDHLYTFFVQWSPDIYGKDAKEQGFVVVEKEELDMIDNFFGEPSTKSWEVSVLFLEFGIIRDCTVDCN